VLTGSEIIAEEIRDASLVLPRATMWAISMNGFIGYVTLITYCFTLGNLDDILSTQTGYPFIQAFYNGTKSHAGASVMTAILIVTITSSVISTQATVSRQTWSFARDKGLPFSSFISHVSVWRSVVNDFGLANLS
jgi:choline transport protein